MWAVYYYSCYYKVIHSEKQQQKQGGGGSLNRVASKIRKYPPPHSEEGGKGSKWKCRYFHRMKGSTTLGRGALQHCFFSSVPSWVLSSPSLS